MICAIKGKTKVKPAPVAVKLLQINNVMPTGYVLFDAYENLFF
jgi:hypothetical protein